MSRPVRRHAVSVSLFPFIAVLICIMGALVILLVLMVARVAAGGKKVAGGGASGTAEEQQKIREEIEDAQWRRSRLAKSRTQKQQELSDSRAELSHLEDHIQRLEGKAKVLLELARSIDEGKQLREGDLAAARTELAKLKDEIGKKKIDADAMRKQQETKERWYALIPYDGPHGTRRRPIYIECTAAGIIIQPEGVALLPEDFRGPMGPGNPLDAALRTFREKLAQGGGKAGEPYPLLVVRPSGVVAYGTARAALSSWEDEFGYELISEDKNLEFGEADPTLSAALEKSVAVARQRQMVLAAAMPRKFGNGDPLTSFADESGGDGSGEGGGGFGGQPGYGGGTGGGAGGFGGSGSGVGGPRGNGSGIGGSGGGNSQGVHKVLPIASGGRGPAGGSGGSGSGGTGSTGVAGGSGQPGGSGPAGMAGGSGDGKFVLGGSMLGGGGGNGSDQGGFGGSGGGGAGGSEGSFAGGGAGQPGSGFGGGSGQSGSGFGGGSGQAGSGSGGGSSFGQLGGGNGAATPNSSMQGGLPLGFGMGSSGAGGGGQSSSGQMGGGMQSGGGGAGGAGGQGGTASAGGTSGSGGSGAKGGHAKSGKSRGANWGLPGSRDHVTAVTRPIHVAVLSDRLVIVPDKGDSRPPLQIPISPRLQSAEVEAFVKNVQSEMKSWGLAVENGYWKPQLLMDVAPDAEQQAVDLSILLEGSGFDLQRKRR